MVRKDSNKMIGYILVNAFKEDVYEIDVHKIFAESIDGIKSAGLMKKLGMKLEEIQRSHTKDSDGNWTDLYLYSLLKDEWNVV